MAICCRQCKTVPSMLMCGLSFNCGVLHSALWFHVLVTFVHPWISMRGLSNPYTVPQGEVIQNMRYCAITMGSRGYGPHGLCQHWSYYETYGPMWYLIYILDTIMPSCDGIEYGPFVPIQCFGGSGQVWRGTNCTSGVWIDPECKTWPTRHSIRGKRMLTFAG